MTPARVVTEARGWLGVKWRHQGRTREGVDCVGLVVMVARALGLSDVDRTDYARQAADETLREIMREHLLEIPAASAAPGDVVLMRFGAQRHVAILGDYVFGGLSLIHAWSLHPRRVVEVRLDDAARARIMGTFRFHQVVT